jgi:hypothetical protein
MLRYAAMSSRARRILFTALIIGGAGATAVACSTVPIPPTYTQAELKAICERRGGWWHDDDLMGGFCEYQSAMLQQAP